MFKQTDKNRKKRRHQLPYSRPPNPGRDDSRSGPLFVAKHISGQGASDKYHDKYIQSLGVLMV